MVYQATDSWHTNSQGTPQQWIGALVNHGVAIEDARVIVQAYVTYFPRAGLNYDMGLAQAVQETGWFSSAHWRNQFNAAGVGVTDDTAVGGTWKTPDEGISGHAGHVCCYVYTADQCPIEHNTDISTDTDHYNDPRHVFHDGMDRLMDLERPNRKWAFPGDGYIDAILTIANSVVGQTQPVPAPPGQAKRLTELPIDWTNQTSVNVFGANGNTWPGRGGSPVRCVCVHVMDGSYEGSISWANNPVSNASFNFGVAKDGRIGCVVDPRGSFAPWANGVMNPGGTNLPDALADLDDGIPNLNWVSVSIEHEGHPFDGDFPTPLQLDASTQLCAAIMIEFGLEPSRDTIIGHYQVDPASRPNCPGPNFNVDAYAARVQAIMAGDTSIPAATGPNVKINGHVIQGGFLGNLWSATKHPVQTFGLPISEEYDAVIRNTKTGEEKHVVAQDFDRQTMIHDASESNPEWQDTTLQRDWHIATS